MHRSGTSMVARLLNLSGLYLGAEHELVTPKVIIETAFGEHAIHGVK